jgi:hypothetical protein
VYRAYILSKSARSPGFRTERENWVQRVVADGHAICIELPIGFLCADYRPLANEGPRSQTRFRRCGYCESSVMLVRTWAERARVCTYNGLPLSKFGGSWIQPVKITVQRY